MSTAAVPRVDVSSLNLGSQLGAGGQGRVVAVSGFLAGGRWPAALKLYSPEVLGQMRVAALEVITGLPGRLAQHDRAWLLESTAWPAAIAEDRGRVCGSSCAPCQLPTTRLPDPDPGHPAAARRCGFPAEPR
jgi:hypothetical protein